MILGIVCGRRNVDGILMKEQMVNYTGLKEFNYKND
jgi:hypothetical protein